MKQETVDQAMDVTIAQLQDATAQPVGARGPRPDVRCTGARAVYGFLTGLLSGANWVERQIIRTVRGYVKSWLDRNGCPTD